MVLTVVTLAVVVFIIAVGIFYIHPTNWTESPGGFFPYGATGVSRFSDLHSFTITSRFNCMLPCRWPNFHKISSMCNFVYDDLILLVVTALR